MTATSTTLKGRTLAEALMIDACIITRGGGSRVFSDVTGTYVTPPGSTVYTGGCQIQISGVRDAADVASEAGEIVTQTITVKLPIDATVYKIHDVVTVTASILDPALVGRRFRVTGLHAKTFATSRRLQCEEIASSV